MREGEWLAESDSAPRTGKAAQLLRQLSHPALAAGDVPVDDELLPAGPGLMGGHLGQQLCRRRSQPDGAGTLPGAGKLRLQLNVFIFPGTLPDAADGFLQLLGRTDGQVRQVMASDVFQQLPQLLQQAEGFLHPPDVLTGGLGVNGQNGQLACHGCSLLLLGGVILPCRGDTTLLCHYNPGFLPFHGICITRCKMRRTRHYLP